jgi:hypothetical protein
LRTYFREQAKDRTQNSEWYSYCKGAKILEVQVAHQQGRQMDMWKVHKVTHEGRPHMINTRSTKAVNLTIADF